jgi:hypothetical protein
MILKIIRKNAKFANRGPIILPRILGCDLRAGFGLDDWIYCRQIITASDIELSLIYTLFKSPGYAKASQCSLVESW